MEQHYKNFISTFYQFISDLNRYSQNPGTQKALDIYNNLDMAKVIFRTYHLMNDSLQKIQSKDDTLFKNPFVLLPDVDISVYWPTLIKGQREKIWTYLNILYLETEFLMNKKEPVQQTPTSSEQQVAETKAVDFNPFVGINGDNNVESVSVDSMLSSIPTTDESSSSGPGIESIAKAIGLNKMINIDDLTNQLKNMKKEDIDVATNNIKELLGNNVDEKTSGLITDMLTNISTEMKKNELSQGDPFKNLLNVAEIVASKMKPKIEENNIDVAQLINSTQLFASQCKDNTGKPIFNDKMNPFTLLNQLTSGGQGTLNEEQCAQQCNNMLKNMGLNNIDVNNLNLNKMMSQLGKQKPPQNKKGGKRKKKN
jgi:hypothetical protein